ncbi:hypothetical protein [Actinoplanes sp. GCM10030250]|uniref:CdiA C-terminal domain-containing protein n=1 Tax=Actinoplanes sp. GCM10030250 TaxID=3273376 RepID=UPI00361E47CA
MGTSLVAAVEDSTTAVTGFGLVEDAHQIAEGIRDHSWVDVTLGGVGTSLDTLAVAMDPLGTLAAWGVAWLMEHVRPLQDALDWLAGNPDEITAHAATWSNVAAFTDTAHHDFANRLGAETAGWSGASAEAYRAHANKHLVVLQGISTAAAGISSAVEGTGLLVALVRGIVRDLIAQFVATLAIRLPQWLAMEGLSLGLATPLVAGQVAGLVARWVNEIQRCLRALLNSLRHLVPKIDNLSKVLDHLRMAADRLARSSPTAAGKSQVAGTVESAPVSVSRGSGPTTPSTPPEPGRKPHGDRTDAHPTRRKDNPLRRENESADRLSEAGFHVEQNPPTRRNGKNPDYRIEGTYFDCYAPQGGNLDTIRAHISDKVSTDQASHLILNLEDTPRSMDEIEAMLRRRPVAGLDEILVIKGGKVIPFYPFGE